VATWSLALAGLQFDLWGGQRKASSWHLEISNTIGRRSWQLAGVDIHLHTSGDAIMRARAWSRLLPFCQSP
jgi:hypothetical protein